MGIIIDRRLAKKETKIQAPVMQPPAAKALALRWAQASIGTPGGLLTVVATRRLHHGEESDCRGTFAYPSRKGSAPITRIASGVRNDCQWGVQ
jgi:hypothetical protein